MAQEYRTFERLIVPLMDFCSKTIRRCREKYLKFIFGQLLSNYFANYVLDLKRNVCQHHFEQEYNHRLEFVMFLGGVTWGSFLVGYGGRGTSFFWKTTEPN